MSFGTSFEAFANGLNGSIQQRKDRAERSEVMRQNDKLVDLLGQQMRQQGQMQQEGRGLAPPSLGYGAASPDDRPATSAAQSAQGGSGGKGGGLFDLLRKHEGAGDPDTLFGHAQREGGPFAGTKISNMSVGEAIEFANPKGAYAQYVAKKNGGTVATPMGEGQIVGSTLRRAAKAMNLDPSTPFNQSTQRAVIDHLARSRLSSASSMPGKLTAIRNEWVGFKNVPDEQLASAIAEYEAQGGGRGLPVRR